MPSGPFDEVQFPPGVSYGSSFGPGFNTSIIQTQGGREQRVPLWESALRRYDLRETVKSPAKIAEILTFFMARQGATRGFRLKDWLDYSTAADHGAAPDSIPTAFDQALGVGDGTKTVYQLVKRYTSGGQSAVRNITKPVAGTVKIAVEGVEAGSGWSVNTATGLVTFTSAPTAGQVLTWGGLFDVPVRFASEVDRSLPIEYSTFGTREISSLPMVEIRDDLAIASDLNYGGSYELATAANWTFDPRLGRLWVVNATASGKSGSLWDLTGFPSGTDILVVANDGANSFDIKTAGGSTLITLASGAVCRIILSITSGGTVVPYAVPG